MRRPRASFAICAAAVCFFAAVVVAHAFEEGYALPWGAYDPNNLSCPQCHGSSDPAIIATIRQGPHGGFSDVTDFCVSCHQVHEASSTARLLPAPTVFGTCRTCHDLSFTGTGGLNSGGVYGAIRAQGAVVRARHNIEGYNETETSPPGGAKSYVSTSTIPGGATLAGNLGCQDCHTPHGNTVMAPWAGQRWRMSLGATLAPSNKILQDDVGGAAKGTYAVYGADWCAGCHDRRHSGAKVSSGINNHPVDQTGARYLDTSMAANGLSWQDTAPADAVLPTRQAGWSREASAGWKPMCQQCHNDLRNVETTYYVDAPQNDGRNAAYNPRWQVFPHESVAEYFQVETGDDLCLNCHPTTVLP